VGYTRATAQSPLIKFDSTLDRGTGPLLVKHGSGRIVQGLEEAIHATTVSRTPLA
jgi:FKBP-type peptidyl-prolyl cis-trans isomerase 2